MITVYRTKQTVDKLSKRYLHLAILDIFRTSRMSLAVFGKFLVSYSCCHKSFPFLFYEEIVVNAYMSILTKLWYL